MARIETYHVRIEPLTGHPNRDVSTDKTAAYFSDRQVHIEKTESAGNVIYIRTTEVDSAKARYAILASPRFMRSLHATNLKTYAERQGLEIIVGRLGG